MLTTLPALERVWFEEQKSLDVIPYGTYADTPYCLPRHRDGIGDGRVFQKPFTQPGKFSERTEEVSTGWGNIGWEGNGCVGGCVVRREVTVCGCDERFAMKKGKEMGMAVGPLGQAAVQFYGDRILFGNMSLFSMGENGKTLEVVVVGNDNVTFILDSFVEKFF